jgi:hypothetical protein
VKLYPYKSPELQEQWREYAVNGRDSAFFYNALGVREEVDRTMREPDSSSEGDSDSWGVRGRVGFDSLYTRCGEKD